MASSTLDELKYYCEQENPAGALMLTGEWGSGKTYLVDSILSKALEETHIIIRISLFGISSIEAAFAAVKQAWLEACLENAGKIGAALPKILKAKDDIANMAKTLDSTAGAVLSVDITKFISMSKRIGDKKIVLVFDDLERCRVGPVELLGVINEYCENQGLHTIIISNEKHLLQRESGTGSADKDGKEDSGAKQSKAIRYDEIKEKVICRTIEIISDYDSAVESIIEKYATEDNAYKQFLKGHITELQNLFSDGIPMTNDEFGEASLDNEKLAEIRAAHNPHNLRSFRCAIQDFHRVYCLLNSQRIEEPLEEWLYAFVMFTMAAKAGIIVDSERYGTFFSDVEVSRIYPAFYKDKYMLDFEKAWVFHGKWDENKAIAQIQNYKEMKKAATPYDIVRTYSLWNINDEDLIEGFPKVLDSAYGGELSLDDYILLIENIASARIHKIELPLCVDWEKMQAGVEKQIEFLEQSREDVYGHRLTSENNMERLLPEEREAYMLIHEFRDKDRLMYAKNRKDFLDLLEKDCELAFVKCQSKRFRCFDSQMADAVARGFSACKNAEKVTLLSDFKKMWGNRAQSPDTDLEQTLEGFRALKSILSQSKSDIAEEKQIALSLFNEFIAIMDKLISEVEDRIQTGNVSSYMV